MTDRRRAQVLVFFALVLPLVLLPVAAYAVDAAVSASAFARLEEVTVHAAEQAASQLDVLRLRSGRGVAVEPGTAQSVARAVIAGSMPGAQLVEVKVSGATVRVRTSQSLRLPVQFIGAPGVVLHASATARLTPGYDSPSSLLPFPVNTF